MKLLLTLFLLSSTITFAQVGTQVGMQDSRWTFGGYAGLGGSFVSGGSTSVYLSPRVGYKFSGNFESGVAGSLEWVTSNYYSSTVIGVGPFGNYYFARNFYLTGLFQEYFFTQQNKYTSQKFSGNESALYLGGGFMQRLANRTYMQIGAMYNVLYDRSSSVFGSGFLPSIGVVFGL